MKKNTFAALLLSALLLSSCAGAGETAGGGTTADTGAVSSAETVTTAPEYVYPELDYKGGDLRFLSHIPIWGIYTTLDVEKQTGEILDDAVYTRNRSIEERYNCKISVNEISTTGSFEKVTNEAYTLILAGEDRYDFVYLKIASNLGMMNEGCLYDLHGVSSLQLGGDWWDHVFLEDAELCGRLYFATSSLMLMPFDTAWCLYFNEALAEDYKFERPYDLVINGEWTLAKYVESCKKAAKLNGANDWSWKVDSKTLYGVANHTQSINAMIYGCGVRYTEAGSNGNPVFSLDNERFYNVAQDIADFAATEGAFFKSNDGSDPETGSYSYCFANRRSYFMVGQVKSAVSFRNMEDNFGLLPFPKYDEAQEEYYTYITPNNLTFTMPITNAKPEETGAILDALTYESYKQVIPVYYDVTVSQKGLRNEDSIEMLDIIRAGRGINAAEYYGWNAALSALTGQLRSGDGAVSSIVAANKAVCEASIAKTVGEFKKAG